MFVPSGSFAEIVLFLEGIELGYRQCNGQVKDNSASITLDWIASESGIDRNSWIPGERANKLRSRFPDESKALSELQRYLKSVRP